MSINVVPLKGRIPEWSFADRVRRVRRDMHLSQEKFAEQLGVGLKAYSAWESGKNTPANIVETATELERVTGVPKTWFIGWLDDDRPRGGASTRSNIVFPEFGDGKRGAMNTGYVSKPAEVIPFPRAVSA